MGLGAELVVVGELAHGLGRGLHQPLLAEPERRAPQARKALDIGFAGLVIDVDALALANDEGALPLVQAEVGVRVEGEGDVPRGG